MIAYKTIERYCENYRKKKDALIMRFCFLFLYKNKADVLFSYLSRLYTNFQAKVYLFYRKKEEKIHDTRLKARKFV